MQRCPICDGRTMKTSEGIKCMNSNCDGSKAPIDMGKDDMTCKKCGQKLQYIGLNSYGEPKYACAACGVTTKL